jgi:hypothetical protein
MDKFLCWNLGALLSPPKVALLVPFAVVIIQKVVKQVLWRRPRLRFGRHQAALPEPSLVVDGMANGLPCAAEHTLRPFWHVLTKITRSTEQNCCENL